MIRNTLYVSLTGMTEPLGQSQVLAYIEKMNKSNNFYLVSFEKDISKIEKLKDRLIENNIQWYPLIYNNKYGIFSSFYQVLIAVLLTFKIAFNVRIDVLHARSMIPAIMLYPLSKIFRKPLVFDIRDFATDEKVDRGRIKKNSLLYKILINIEHHLYRYSHKIIALTKASKDILVDKIEIDPSKIYIIPTCADKNVFFKLDDDRINSKRLELGYKQTDVIYIHVGSVREWYLFEEELDYFRLCLEINKNSKLLVLNNYDHDYINIKFKEYGLDDPSVSKVLSVDFKEVNSFINIADYAIYFIIPSFSKKAAAPTKFAEFVRVDLPSITNCGVGDMDFYVSQFNVGVLVDPYNLSKERVLDSITKINLCRLGNYSLLFENYFSVEVAVKEYQRVYDEI